MTINSRETILRQLADSKAGNYFCEPLPIAEQWTFDFDDCVLKVCR